MNHLVHLVKRESGAVPARSGGAVSSARDVLLDKTMAHVAAHGMSDLSLRELAAAIGTSHRMLLYHFGSREGLVAAIVDAMESQQREALEDLATGASSPRKRVATRSPRF